MISVIDMGAEVYTLEWTEAAGKVTVGSAHVLPKAYYLKIMKGEQK